MKKRTVHTSFAMLRLALLGLLLSGCGYQLLAVHSDSLRAALSVAEKDSHDVAKAYPKYIGRALDQLEANAPIIVDYHRGLGRKEITLEDAYADLREERTQAMRVEPIAIRGASTILEIRKNLNLPETPSTNLDKAMTFLTGALIAAGVALAL